MSEPTQDLPDRLSGWKDIAAFLGKSVRSAQRWESELGLPVERLTGPDGGQIVQASRRELESWRRSRLQSGASEELPADVPAASQGVDGQRSGSDLCLEHQPVPPVIAPDASSLAAAPAAVRSPSWWMAVALLATGVASGIAVTLTALPVIRTPLRFEIHGTVVQALTEHGEPVWTHELSHVASRPGAASSIGGRVGDLDGDGALEAAVPIAYTVPWAVTPDTSDEVRIFSRRGALRTVVRPDIAVDHDGSRHDGPWLFHASTFATFGRGRLWTTFTGVTGGPSFVLETDAGGLSRVRFVIAGTVNAVAHWTVGGRERLIVGGHDGATRRAFVAAIPLDGDGTRWPEGASGPSCATCGVQAPETIALFPVTELMEAMLQPNSHVIRIRPERDRLVVETEAGVRPAAMFWLDAGLEVATYRWLPRYQAMHRELEADGRITHSLEECEEHTGQLQVRRWRPDAGWSDQLVPAGSRGPLVPAGG